MAILQRAGAGKPLFKWTDIRRAKLRRLIAAGKSNIEIAKVFEISAKAVDGARRKYGHAPVQVEEAVLSPAMKARLAKGCAPLGVGDPVTWGAITSMPFPGDARR